MTTVVMGPRLRGDDTAQCLDFVNAFLSLNVVTEG
jgi:hypothetical protein